MNHPYRLALTAGEPAGIGPELCVQIAQQGHADQLIIVADPNLLLQRAALLGLELELIPFDPAQPPQATAPGQLYITPVPLTGGRSEPGQLDPSNGQYVLDTLERAARGCLSGEYDALVTAPVHKGIINEAGIPFSGHTEFLEQLTSTEKVVMMLATEGLRVALATTHLPLSEVPGAITPRLLEQVLHVLIADLQRYFHCPRPRILICGLNPHAGEGGHLGREELDIIIPTLERMRPSVDAELIGPLPADTLFTAHHLQGADAVLAMYHDQGLPVLKYQGFGRAVNITLGLPIIRTSVDHGTALDLAGSGRADTGSLLTAIDYAGHMAAGQRKHDSHR